MLTIQDYIPVTKAKITFLDIIRKIEGSNDAIAITKNGVPEAVLLSMKSIKEARDGKWLNFDEVLVE
jgi:prevent-host-death family protein